MGFDRVWGLTRPAQVPPHTPGRPRCRGGEFAVVDPGTSSELDAPSQDQSTVADVVRRLVGKGWVRPIGAAARSPLTDPPAAVGDRTPRRLGHEASQVVM